MKVSWDDKIPNIWKNKKCSKAPTSHDMSFTISRSSTRNSWLGQITRNGPALNGPALNWKPRRTSQGKWYLYDIQLSSANLTARWVYGTDNSMRVARSQRYPLWGGLKRLPLGISHCKMVNLSYPPKKTHMFIAHIIFLHFADSNNKHNNQHEMTLNDAKKNTCSITFNMFFLVGNCMNKNTHVCFC